MIITNAASGCGCLYAIWPKEPVMPNSSGIIKVIYHTKRVGFFNKTITVISNADRHIIVLKIKGVVKPESTPAAIPVQK